jgi:dipeptidyl aminopeptidase/acylaminoacyl peptidase
LPTASASTRLLPIPSSAPTRAEFVAEPEFAETSPDGLWTANSFGYYPPIRMEVTGSDGSASWEVVSDGEGWFEVVLRPEHWSVDGLYLYFTLAPFVDGFILYMDGSGLQRQNLSNGDVTQVLAGNHQLQSFSISPDSTRLVFFRTEEDATWLVVRDLRDGTELQWRLADEAVQAGGIRWSSDGTAFIVRVTDGYSYEDARTTVLLISLQSLAQKTLLADDPRFFWRVEWLDEHTLYLEDMASSGWRLDLRSDEMIPAPTPTAMP